MEEIYRKCWQELIRVRREQPSLLEPDSTPILTFGDGTDAIIATAGLNPSQNEFRENGLILPLKSRRFLHFSEINRDLTDENIKEAKRRYQNYFFHNPYNKWFNHYSHFLRAMDSEFTTKKAIHTDYYSPFATKSGLSNFEKKLVQNELLDFGMSVWKQVLEHLPKIRLIFGHGQGHIKMPKLFGFEEWTVLPLPFEKALRCHDPLLFREILINGRKVKLIWWKVNLNGHPLTILSHEERTILGRYIGSFLDQP